ncbi:MAG TPA: glycosyltransferase family 4 protein [Pyrinomonadaceae bacterium]|nr:glycosyltransferase family 4 protein [Pyrinomonadaceae bacterium]
MTVKKPFKVLLTAPSLDEKQNVSGISTVARQIIERGTFEYRHFEAGRRDGERARIGWIRKQIVSVRRFRRAVRDADVVHLNTNFNPLAIVRDAVYAATARAAKIPLVVHVHGGRYLAEEFQSGWLKKIAEKMLRAGDAVVVLSEQEKKIIENRWRNLNVRVLENAVAVDEAVDAERKTDEKTLIFLGRLHESKGLHEIVEACRRLKNENFRFRFKCFGAGERKDFFVAEMTRILGEKFYYGGVATGAEKWKELATADIFLLPSRYGEGLPVAMLEAMASGCVVIVSEMASTGAVVEDGENGFLIEPRSVAQLVEKLKLLLAGEIDSERLRKNARATIKARFDLNDYIERLENIYAEILSAASKRS